MKHRILLILMVLCTLAACGNNDTTQDNSDESAESASRSDGVGAGTAFYLASLATPQPTAAIPDPTNTPRPDPGPYLSTDRPEPDVLAADFSPPESVADTMLHRSVGQCSSPAGQSSEYITTENEIVYLSCQFLPRRADDRLQSFANSSSITGEPIVYTQQPGASFVLGASGNGYVYAWTNGFWFFSARTLHSRPLLDAFMQDFPY